MKTAPAFWIAVFFAATIALAAPSKIKTAAPKVLRGQIHHMGDKAYLKTESAEYEIRWMAGFTANAVCYSDTDKLCPKYNVYFRAIQRTPTGTVLKDAVAVP